MLTTDTTGKCVECGGQVIDAQEELVCTSCGMVTTKEIVDDIRCGSLQAIDFTGQGVGGYLGSAEPTAEERHSRGLSGTKSNFRYLKQMSDYTGREDSMLYSCARLIERVCERLMLPRVVMADSVITARKLLSSPVRSRASSAAISVYSIVLACKTMRSAQVGVREIITAQAELGRRVKTSELIQISLQAPFKSAPRRPEDCTARLIARLFASPAPPGAMGETKRASPASLVSLKNRATEMIQQADAISVVGHNPWALAATAIYSAEVVLAAIEQRDPRLTQKQVASAAGVAEYTVREQYRAIFKGITRVRLQARPALQIPLAK